MDTGSGYRPIQGGGGLPSAPDKPAAAAPGQAPPPPPPPPPFPRAKAAPAGGRPPGGGGRTVLASLATALVTTLVILVVLPLAFGNSPLDFFRGKAEQKTVVVEQPANMSEEAAERVEAAGMQAVVAAASKTLPAVVNIEVTTLLGGGVGSGFIYREDGYIVTNNHVVGDARSIKVSLLDGKVMEARVVGTDPDNDLAVIKIDASGLPVAELGSSAGLVVGELAIAMGSPQGFEQSVTSGIISGLHRNVSGSVSLLDVIQTDAAINPGNSGGPLCNAAGQVIGINTAIYSQSGGYDGIGFAIPIDTVKPVVEELIKSGKVVHPWMGISGATLTPEVAKRYNLKAQSGALVREVYRGAPADKAGLQTGDIIVEIGGQAIDSMDSLILEVRRHKVGDKVGVKYYRNDDLKETEVVLSAKPSTY